MAERGRKLEPEFFSCSIHSGNEYGNWLGEEKVFTVQDTECKTWIENICVIKFGDLFRIFSSI